MTQQSAQRSGQILTPEDYAYSRLIAYAAYQWPGYRDAPHHRLIARKLEAVERGEITRLMITMPPRHGKSMLASEFFPAWYLGRNSDHSVVMATYAQELADDFGRKVKNQIEDNSFPEIFDGVGLADDSKSVKRFHVEENNVVLEGGFEHALKQRGSFYAVGVGGPLTGRGAHLLLIDDPVKNREDADSEIIRKKTKDWYTSTAYTRLMPGGRVVIIQTRWHEEDLSGWLLAEHQHEGWEVLNLPAIDRDGKALWPEQYDVPALNRIKLAIGARDWSALYQQAPTPDDGNYFKADWLRPYEKAPPLDTMRVYGGSDYAVTMDGGDWTCHVVIGLDPEGRMYLLDLWRRQASSDVWVEAFCDLVKQWQPIGWAEEQGQIRAGVGPYIDRRQRERQAWCVREQFPTRGDKAVRAQSIRGRMALEGLYVPINAQWYPDLRSELLSFPAGKHDDQVDALGLVGQLLDRMLSGDEPAKPEKAKNPSGYSAHEAEARDNDWLTI